MIFGIANSREKFIIVGLELFYTFMGFFYLYDFIFTIFSFFCELEIRDEAFFFPDHFFLDKY
jgi:hypothetical protein